MAKKRVMFRLHQEQIDLLDLWAKERGMNRTQVLEALIYEEKGRRQAQENSKSTEGN